MIPVSAFLSPTPLLWKAGRRSSVLRRPFEMGLGWSGQHKERGEGWDCWYVEDRISTLRGYFFLLRGFSCWLDLICDVFHLR